MAKTIHTDKAPAAIGPYVQGKIVGNLLFASGQVPLSPETGEITVSYTHLTLPTKLEV